MHRTVGNSFAAFLETLAQCENVTSKSYRYYFGRCSADLAQLVPLSYSQGRSTQYSDRLHDFSVILIFLDAMEFSAYRMLFLTYDLNKL